MTCSRLIFEIAYRFIESLKNAIQIGMITLNNDSCEILLVTIFDHCCTKNIILLNSYRETYS